MFSGRKPHRGCESGFRDFVNFDFVIISPPAPLLSIGGQSIPAPLPE